MAKTRAKTKAEKEPAEPPKAPPERTPEEQALVDSYKNREWIDRPPRKKLTKRPDGTFNASFEGDVDLEVSKLARADMPITDARALAASSGGENRRTPVRRRPHEACRSSSPHNADAASPKGSIGMGGMDDAPAR